MGHSGARKGEEGEKKEELKKKRKKETGREEGERGDKKRKMTSSQLNGRGGAMGCGPARAPLAGVRA